jgi:hypothetical protein
MGLAWSDDESVLAAVDATGTLTLVVRDTLVHPSAPPPPLSTTATSDPLRT